MELVKKLEGEPALALSFLVGPGVSEDCGFPSLVGSTARRLPSKKTARMGDKAKPSLTPAAALLSERCLANHPRY